MIGPALDGGWWVLVLRDSARAGPLTGVAMSTPTTCADTRATLTGAGLLVTSTTTLGDVDTVADAAPQTRFAEAWAAVVRVV